MITMPAVVVLIACKVVVAGPPDQNASYTKAENLAWATEGSMMVCRRHEIPIIDPAWEMGAEPKPLNEWICNRSAVGLIPRWDELHRNTRWRAWKVGCPTPIVDTRTGAVIGYKLPECGRRDIVRCDIDAEI